MDFDKMDFNDGLLELISAYEFARSEKQKLYFDSDDFERIIVYYLDNRSLKKAKECIEEAIEHYPFDTFFYVKKAELLAEKGKTEEAFNLLAYAETIDATDPNIYLVKADLFLWKGLFEESLNVINEALKMDLIPEEKCELYLEMADVYENMERTEEIVESLKMALRSMPENEEALGRLWFTYEITENFRDSIKFHKELIDLAPYSILAWFNLGHAYASLDMFEEALDALSYCTAIDEKFEPAHTCAGDVYFLQEKYEDALQCYLISISIQKNFKELYFKTGECYEKKEDFKRAKLYFRKAIALDPQYDEAFFRIGEIQVRDLELGKAILSFQKAIKINPDEPEYLNSLAELLMFEYDDNEAISLYEKCLELDHTNKQFHVNLATAYFNFEMIEESFQVLDDALEEFDDIADLLYIRFVFLYKKGKIEEAKINLQQALETDFNLHNIIFSIDEQLESDPIVIQIIELYR